MSRITALTANWNFIKEKTKEKFALVTDREMILGRYNRKELKQEIQIRIAKAKVSIERYIFEL